MELTQYQIERIKRFFIAVTALSSKTEIRLNPKLAKRALEAFMDPTKTPAQELPNVDLLDTQVAFFKKLSIHGIRNKHGKAFFQVLLVIAFVIASYAAYRNGIALGLVTLAISLIVSFVLNLTVAKFYIWKDFSPLKYGLTRTEVQFALDAIITDSKWQQKTEEMKNVSL